MNIKRFRAVCRFTSIILKIVSLLTIFVVSAGLYSRFFGSRNVWFDFNMPDFPIINSMSGPLTDGDMRLASLIITPFIAMVRCYVFWKGSQLFNYLAEGNKPFSNEFSQSVKKLSLILIITDVAFPLIYSLLVTTIMEGNHYYIIGVGSPFLIGLILYAVSEIFNYAITLQRLSDDTV